MSTYEQFQAVKSRGATPAAGDAGVPMIGIRKDVAADLAGSDGKYTFPQFDATGNLRVVPSGGGDASAANQTAGNTLTGAVNETAPATDTASSGLNGRLQRIAQRLTTALTGIVLAAGTNEVGLTNIKHFNVAATGAGILTRPANTTAYTANDSVSDNATAGSVTALPVTVADANDQPLDIISIVLDCSDTGFGAAQFKIHLFESDPTANTGVGAGDNVAYSQKKAGWIGSFTGTMTAFSDGCRATMIPDGPTVSIAKVETGGRRIWWQLQIMSAATPAGNSSVFTPRFKGYQGRP